MCHTVLTVTQIHYIFYYKLSTYHRCNLHISLCNNNLLKSSYKIISPFIYHYILVHKSVPVQKERKPRFTHFSSVI